MRIALSLTLLLASSALAGAEDLSFHTPYYRATLAANQPNFTELAIDSLGKDKLAVNVMLPLKDDARKYVAVRKGQSVEYRLDGSGAAAWTFTFAGKSIVLRSNYSARQSPQPLTLGFNPILCHATLLGLFDGAGAIRLPALLHFPDRGTFRITTSAKGLALGYDALRDKEDFVRVTFPPASAAQPSVVYTWEVTAIYPHVASMDNDPRYDGFRRDFLNILQINPRDRVLANHAASDPVAFTVFLYSMMAAQMPPLADGLSALSIVRQTLDRYASGMKGYGMAGYKDNPELKYDFLDSYPSLVMASAEYVRASHDRAWLANNYAVVKSWADKMIALDVDGDGLMEYPLSGNSGIWPEHVSVRPSNWWDTIGFGHKDAYANALAFKAFNDMAELARSNGRSADARLYSERAAKLKSVYFDTFYNPATGVLAGWKSADGKLHDYYFLFVNGMAVTHGLLTKEQGNRVWDRLLAKMKEVGYTRFELGLPGNLIRVLPEDYADKNHRFGYSEKADGSDGFQVYENGGATACWAYYTIQALRDLGRNKEADAILFPMLKGFEDGGFQGRGPNGQTYDWKDWNGGPHGYEGLLVDGYQTLLAALPGGGK
ncbi:MAG: hypothetical protein P4K98_00160 [Bryobacteraceae bacterium]|nr:hypothetical protein [Bryobacteraceae bacterium]